MITDQETNLLYLADSLPKKHSTFYQNFEKVLIDCGIDYNLLPNTKDIWARDYMPVQLQSDRYVKFTYNPDYLQSTNWLKTISDTDKICKAIGIDAFKSKIVLDGGNVVKSSDKVILCDKIFSENPHLTEKKLLRELKDTLEVDQIIVIPTDPSDKIGHSDGMVRFLDDKTVLINDYSKEKPTFQRSFRMALHNASLDWIEVPYNPYGNKKAIQANGIYINYLQMKGKVILPTFGLDEDDRIFNQFDNLFKGNQIATIDCNAIANEGGILNCITWNIAHKL